MTSIISTGNVGIEMKFGALLFMNSVGLSVDLDNLAERFCPMPVKYSLNLSAGALSFEYVIIPSGAINLSLKIGDTRCRFNIIFRVHGANKIITISLVVQIWRTNVQGVSNN